MSTTNQRKRSPLLVKSHPPSLVVDRFCYPASEDELLLAAAAHLGDDVDDRDAVDAKLEATQRELRDAASPLTRDRGR